MAGLKSKMKAAESKLKRIGALIKKQRTVLKNAEKDQEKFERYIQKMKKQQ